MRNHEITSNINNNKLIGSDIPTSDDEISIIKTKLYNFKIITTIISMILISILCIVYGFYARDINISIEYQVEQKLPKTSLVFMQGDPNNINLFNLKKYKGSQMIQDLLTLRYNGSDTYSIDTSLPHSGYNCLYATITDMGYENKSINFHIVEDCITLSEAESVYLTFINKDSSSIRVFLAISNSFEIFSGSVTTMNKISKNIYVDSKGVESVNYKNFVTMDQPLVYFNNENYTENDQFNSFGIAFSSNFILKESVQTNTQVLIGVLSNVGSSITVVILVFEILFLQITKLLIQDKSAWIDDNVRNCILYHSDQINLNNLNSNTIDSDSSDNENSDQDDNFIIN